MAFILAFAVGFAIAVSIDNQILLLFDTITACMLGLSAFLQSYMYREYYLVRIVSVAMSAVLWGVVFSVQVFSMGALGIVLLYLMYLFVDVASYIFWIKSSVPYDKDFVEELDEHGRKKLVQEKTEEYNKSLRAVHAQENEDKGIDA